MTHFNLITDPWIPVRWCEGSRPPELIGLRELFLEGDHIADLSATPHERISLMRLFVCIAQSALGAPPHPGEWEGFGEDIGSVVPEYLDRPEIQDRFELFGDGSRFLQGSINGSKDPVPASKLFPHLATGNNPTVFDHAGGTERTEPASLLALGLLTFQNFYPLYGAGYKGKGPCVDGNMLHLLLQGATIADTIRMNSLDAETMGRAFPKGMGRPWWELSQDDPDFERNATETYLGRLVPRHRTVKLTDDRTGFYLTKESLLYPVFEAAIEPTATVVLRRKGNDLQRALLPARLDRAIWRDLHLMCSLYVSDHDEKGAAPLILQSHAEELDNSDHPATLIWTGALVTDLKAKILDSVESTFTVPTRMLHSIPAQIEYENGVAFSESMSKRLFGAVKTYASKMKHENAPVEAAQRYYWHSLDRESHLLLDLVGDPDAMKNREFGKGVGDEADSWTRCVRRALHKAYEATCPRQTPRQYEAYATGLRVLHPKPKKPASSEMKTASQPAAS